MTASLEQSTYLVFYEPVITAGSRGVGHLNTTPQPLRTNCYVRAESLWDRYTLLILQDYDIGRLYSRKRICTCDYKANVVPRKIDLDAAQGSVISGLRLPYIWRYLDPKCCRMREPSGLQ